MPVEYVLDASVAAKLFFIEDQSDLAYACVRRAERLIAPQLLQLELASIMARRARAGVMSQDRGREMLVSLSKLLDEAVDLKNLARPAFELAASHAFSVYDSVYLALARDRGLPLLTADMKLVALARRSGLGDCVAPLSPGG